MLITFFKSLSEEIHMLESTWHHVSQEEGVKLQHDDELLRAKDFIRDEYAWEPRFEHRATRRIVRGKFHPGRRVLPTNAVYYELVYECSGYSEKHSDDDFLAFLREICYSDTVEMSGSLRLGDVTNEKEENVA